MTELVFTVFGLPQPQGSAKAFMPKGSRYPVVTSDNPNLKAWRRDVARAALSAGCAGRQPHDGPMRVELDFYLHRPQALKVDRPHITRPDVDKLARGILDALTGVVWRDDGQVVTLTARKFYTEAGVSPRAVILVQPEDLPLMAAAERTA